MDGAVLKLGVQKTDIAGFLPYNLVCSGLLLLLVYLSYKQMIIPSDKV